MCRTIASSTSECRRWPARRSSMRLASSLSLSATARCTNSSSAAELASVRACKGTCGPSRPRLARRPGLRRWPRRGCRGGLCRQGTRPRHEPEPRWPPRRDAASCAPAGARIPRRARLRRSRRGRALAERRCRTGRGRPRPIAGSASRASSTTPAPAATAIGISSDAGAAVSPLEPKPDGLENLQAVASPTVGRSIAAPLRSQ
jgi:hypothetical protein